MERKIDILVSSTSRHKIESVSIAAEAFMPGRVNVTGFKTVSGVNEQPIDEETILGAQNRLSHLRLLTQDHLDAIRIAIENGIFTLDNVYQDRAIVLLETPDNPLIMRESEGVIFPEEAVEEARRRGFNTTTVGAVLAEMNPDIDPTDPHTFLTNGKTSRKILLAEAVKSALKTFLNNR